MLFLIKKLRRKIDIKVSDSLYEEYLKTCKYTGELPLNKEEYSKKLHESRITEDDQFSVIFYLVWNKNLTHENVRIYESWNIVMDRTILKNLANPSSIQLQKLKLKFDLNTLDMIIAFLYKDSVLRTRKTLNNINRLFNNLDERVYANEETPDMKNRIWIIKKTLEFKLQEGIDDNEALKTCVIDCPECDDYTKKILQVSSEKKISHEESRYLIKKLDDALEYGYVVTIKGVISELLSVIDDEDFKSYRSISDDLYSIANTIINIKRSTTTLGSDQTFSLDSEIFDSVVEDALQKLKDRNRIFMTGIRRLNTILSPGYISKRLYIYLAFPGKGKSTILLKSALDIRKYNKGIKTKDPDKRPAVLFLTLENDISETLERMYNMVVDADDIRNYSAKQVKSKLKNEGQLKLTDDNNIDIIIKEYKNRELSTDDLYTIINDLSDEGIETVALIVDYMKRLRPAEKSNGDEKKELKDISNELKEVAKFFDIPVNNMAGVKPLELLEREIQSAA